MKRCMFSSAQSLIRQSLSRVQLTDKSPLSSIKQKALQVRLYSAHNNNSRQLQFRKSNYNNKITSLLDSNHKKWAHSFFKPVSTSIIKSRSCSFHRHIMCGQHGRDIISSTMDVRHARELLPTNVKATHYDLTLEPNLETFDFEGKVIIDLEIVEDTHSISFNTKDIDIKEAILSSNGKDVPIHAGLHYDEDSETTKLDLKEKVEAGNKAQLTIIFKGVLKDNMAGFYRSSYTKADGSKGYLATTQMEPTDARRAFPCFDEPALKSKFSITLIADEHLTCLSNMNVKSRVQVESKMSGGPKKAVSFHTTPLMSTYLVAFIVGEFNMIESNAFRLPMRLYATPDQNIEDGRFALELGAKTLEFYEKTFDSQFPLPKMDIVAIPDFSAGAMENWGLITYRIVDVMFDPKTSGAARKLRVATTVQHELAHQWFGNLVTMDFWDGLWLNEGFATWMALYSCDKFFPDWKLWEAFVTDDLQSALSLDGFRSSHAIEVPIKRAGDVNEIFDNISYAKGSCVIRMISKYLGEDVFLEGIRLYLKRHAYGNTTTNDLWTALSEASGKDVNKVMNVWTKYVGYPVVTVTEDKHSHDVHLEQHRFLRTADVKPEDDTVLYPVFLSLRTKDGVDEDTILENRNMTIKVKDNDFFKLNANHSGFYRTSYSSERLEKLAKAAKSGLLTTEDRAGMLADAGALAASGYQKTSSLLTLLQGYDTESEFVVWQELVSRVASIRAAWIFEDEKVKSGLCALQRDLIHRKAHELGWEFSDDDGHILQQFKALLFSSAALSGDQKTRDAAFEMFKRFVKGDRSAIHPNIRSGVFATVLQEGGDEEYDAVLNEYLTVKTSNEKIIALQSLGRASKPHLIKRTLSLPFSTQVKDQDMYLPLSGLRAHKDGIEALWSWMKTSFDKLEAKFPSGIGMLGSIVGICSSSFTTQDQLDNVRKFFEAKSTKGFERALAQSEDAIEAKKGWSMRDGNDVEKWLKEKHYL